MKKWLKVPLLFVAAHTLLLFLTGLAILVSEHSSNPDSSIGFAMMCISFYIVDYPIGILLEAARPHFEAWGGWLPTVVFLYGVLGNLMWFLAGVIVTFCIRMLPLRNRSAVSVQPPPTRNDMGGHS